MPWVPQLGYTDAGYGYIGQVWEEEGAADDRPTGGYTDDSGYVAPGPSKNEQLAAWRDQLSRPPFYRATAAEVAAWDGQPVEDRRYKFGRGLYVDDVVGGTFLRGHEAGRTFYWGPTYPKREDPSLLSDLVEGVSFVAKAAAAISSFGSTLAADAALTGAAEEVFAEEVLMPDEFAWDDFLSDSYPMSEGGTGWETDWGWDEIPPDGGYPTELPDLGGNVSLDSLLRDGARMILNETLGGGGGAVLPGGARATQAAWPMLPAILGGARAAGTAVARTGGRLIGAGAAALRGVSRKNAVALAKKVGIEAAAVALGVSAIELANMVISEESKRRRGTGITAASMRTTKKTLRKFHSLHRQIKDVCNDAVPRPRRCK